MRRFILAPCLYTGLALAALMILLSALPPFFFTHLSLERTAVAQGEYWRLLTSNFVHFGWYHTSMNVLAFLLCIWLLYVDSSVQRLLAILLLCSLAVGFGIYWRNPEYSTYAGLSGAIHGLIVAGFMANRRHHRLINGAMIALVFGKVIYEHSSLYQPTELQALLPVAVAYDAHAYGAIAGFTIGLGEWLYHHLRNHR